MTSTIADGDARLALTRRIMAIAGHDLKQPLQIALMSLERVAAIATGASVDRHLAVAKAALKRLNVELEDLARNSQVDERLTPRVGRVALRELFDEVGKDWVVTADNCDVGLTFEAPEIVVLTDPAMLKTILRNLVGNALKYSPQRGEVSVTAQVRSGCAVIEVRDNGCGIARDRLSQIFDAFNRGGRSDAGGGLGLGLHIVRETAELLGHSLSVRSVEGEGSVFSIVLALDASSSGKRAGR
ncbi:MAG: HAMP domain-containing sensor histidine kinase [Hansschlegelia sp.]